MACPACDHTMQCIVDGVFWCSRCGTLKTDGAVPEYELPKLVGRVRTLLRCGIAGPQDFKNTCHSIGIEESVFSPREEP